ncbi:hypothetical protein HMPREF0758_1326 [Serratia odorifera DSM 4582]|uniref:Uncharacterized protein n=1 Tax=Serratia odorifera DSM 4582 TaxID=667129 RepID=D4DZH6_SEROD|nr:hypothetical protein HMPREF0758_1326 [Serratia odorifera DSM 4582]
MLRDGCNIPSDNVNKMFLSSGKGVFERLTCNGLIYNIFISPD